MKDDITNDPAELGIIAETAVYKHIMAFDYRTINKVGYYRGGDKNKEIDIVVEYSKSQTPVMVEVKYRENSSIPEKDMIVQLSNSKQPNLVITKRPDDYGIRPYNDEKQIYKIPAPVFLYLLGYAESEECKTL